MKITRVFFNVNTDCGNVDLYFFDRAYDDALTAEQNCDSVLQFLTAQMTKGNTLAVMHRPAITEVPAPKGDTPALVNFNVIATVVIKDVAIFNVEPRQNDAKK
jgi:hypothetical protein